MENNGVLREEMRHKTLIPNVVIRGITLNPNAVAGGEKKRREMEEMEEGRRRGEKWKKWRREEEEEGGLAMKLLS